MKNTPSPIVDLDAWQTAARIPACLSDRLGRCYELAASAILASPAGLRPVLVHGSVYSPSHSTRGPIWHAVVYVPGLGFYWDPVSGWFLPQRWFKQEIGFEAVISYDREAVQRQLVTHGHWGPWHPVFYRKNVADFRTPGTPGASRRSVHEAA